MTPQDPDGPIPLTVPTSLAIQSRIASKQLVDRLRGHSTAANWVPEDFPPISALRPDHVRLRGELLKAVNALDATAAGFAKEDADFAAGQREALRADTPTPVDDRTPALARRDALADAEERVWVTAEVLADHCDKVIKTYRRSESAMLAKLKVDLGQAQEMRRQAQELLREAETVEWRVHRLSSFIRLTADDGGLGRQPVPQAAAMPQNGFSMPTDIERPWHDVRDWADQLDDDDFIPQPGDITIEPLDAVTAATA